MGKKNSRRNQKLYKMKGCSKKNRRSYLGGKPANINLAYPTSNIPTVPNPFLSYTGKGGACSSTLAPSNLDSPQNINGANPAYPSSGPTSSGFGFLNPQGTQHGGAQTGSISSQLHQMVKNSGTTGQKGGSCGCGMPFMTGGKKGGMCPMCSVGFMVGGSHRRGCKCTSCKMKGGSGNNGIPYPDGLVGSPWTPAISGWPGVDGISGDRNYIAPNNYNTDISRQIVDVGANPPFLTGGRRTRRKRQSGGVLSNSLGQDFINFGRQFQFGLGTAYNALAGYQAPVNPLPWKGQLANTTSLTGVKDTYL